MRLLQNTFRQLLQVYDAPERTALSFSIGVFLGFSPLLGLHTILGLTLALLFRLNKMAILAGVYANNPWLMLPFYGFATWFGIQITGMPEGVSLPHVGFLELFHWQFWQWLLTQWRLLIPAVVGSSILCVSFGLISYPLALYVLRKYREE